MKHTKKHLGNKGVSEVMGALMLIAVVIVAVSGIAMIIAQMQKSEMERQSNIDAVEKENLRIMSINPIVNDTDPSMNLLGLSIVVANLNSKDSRIASVVINDKAANNYTSAGDYNDEHIYSFTDRLKIPAGMNKEIRINFSGNQSFDGVYNVSAQRPLKVFIMTENANTYTKTITPPTPVIKTAIETENLGIAERDILVLDGSGSLDDGSILSYVWRIYSFNGTDYNQTSQYSGKKVNAAVNQTGDVFLELAVSDDNNMIGVSDKVRIPYSPNFNPAVQVNASSSSYTGTTPIPVDVSVYDVNGRPLENATVLFISMLGNVVVSPTSNITDATGLASAAIVNGTGTVEIKVGKIEKYVSVV